ncbi:hypothetical protein VNO78_27076 [Psophocarpus tetragonolobus]|uniref:Uncharacterized protein n=1 Tax=Psophocarpus tetragonolobus TaxID=3891 RepID=A0AAN9S131_PSOTE
MHVLLMEKAAEGGSEPGCSGAGPNGPGEGREGVFGLGAWDGGGGGVEGVGGAGAGAGAAAGSDGEGADVGGDGVADGGCVGAGLGACATHAEAKSPNIINTLTAA